MTDSMRAVGLHQFGGPEVLGVVELPRPEPGPHEVLIRVAAATVNPTDLLLRSGAQAHGLVGLSPPYIPGMELAGTIVELGSAVPINRPDLTGGQAVIGVTDPRRQEGGAQAEYIRLPPGSVVPSPLPDLAMAATLPMNGLTALMAMEALDASRGGVVLVTGAAGAVGGYVVQLAHWQGFHVIVDGLPDDVPLLQELGADQIVARGDRMVSEVAKLHPTGVDAVVDAARLGASAFGLVRDSGTAVLLRSDAQSDPRLRSRVILVGTRIEDTEMLREVAALASAGILTPRVAARLPFEQSQNAHKLVEAGGLRGRVVLEM